MHAAAAVVYTLLQPQTYIHTYYVHTYICLDIRPKLNLKVNQLKTLLELLATEKGGKDVIAYFFRCFRFGQPWNARTMRFRRVFSCLLRKQTQSGSLSELKSFPCEISGYRRCFKVRLTGVVVTVVFGRSPRETW